MTTNHITLKAVLRSKIAGGVLALAYLGLGAIGHAIFHGATFSVASAMTWAWLLAWPAIFAIAWAASMLAFFICFCLMAAGGIMLFLIVAAFAGLDIEISDVTNRIMK